MGCATDGQLLARLFDSIKPFLLEEKAAGRLLATADDLFRAFQHAQPDVAGDGELLGELRGVYRAGRGPRAHPPPPLRRLCAAQPELLDAYASAMVQAAREEPDGLGYIPEEIALAGRFGWRTRARR